MNTPRPYIGEGRALLCLILVTFFCVSAWIALPATFVSPSAAGMGETFEAFHAALNLERFGWRWAGLQDMATNPSPTAHPYLYVHHANLGLYYSYALRMAGITSIELQNFLSILGSFLGLALAFGTLSTLTRSLALGAVATIFLGLDFFYMSNWAFNLHRGFTYASVFVTLTAYRAFASTQYRSLLRGGFLVWSCVVLLCADYIFFVFVFTTLVCFTSLSGTATGWKTALLGILALVITFGGVFVLRQVQVIAGAGLDIWQRDFLYQILNRLHLEGLYSGDWSRTTTEFYAAHSVLNPGFAPYAPWSERIGQFTLGTGNAYLVDILGFQGAPPQPSRWAGGLLISMLLLSCGASVWRGKPKQVWPTLLHGGIAWLFLTLTVLGMAAAAVSTWMRFNTYAGVAITAVALAFVFLTILPRDLATFLRQVEWATTAIIHLAIALLVSCMALYALFPRYFMQWYPAFLLAPLCVVVWMTPLISPVINWSDRTPGRRLGIVASLILLKFIAWAPLLSASTHHGGDHALVLKGLNGQPTASNFTPASVATYTNAFSGWVKSSATKHLLLSGTIRPEDYFMLFEADRNTNALYTRPHYYVHFKFASPEGELQSLAEAGAVLEREGATYALFKVPAPPSR